jgi:hypothetical protein
MLQKRNNDAKKKQKNPGKLRTFRTDMEVRDSNFSKNNAPAAVANLQQQTTARIKKSKQGSFIVEHREFVQDIFGTADAFSVSQYAINPGLPGLFPWLASVATRFQKYRFRYLRICYKTSAPSTTQGYVFLVPDYDSSDSRPTTKTQALQYKSAKRGNIWESFHLDCAPEDLSALPQYYTRGGSIPNTDIKTYDVGQLFVVMLGPASNSGPMGELWVEYGVELISPYIPVANFNISDLAIAATATIGTAWGLTRTVKSNNISVTFSDSGQLLIFNQQFNGMLFLKGVGVDGYVPLISGALTNTGSIEPLTFIVSGNEIYYYAYIEMLGGSYLAFNDFTDSDSKYVNIFYTFAPSLQKLWF